jgi:ribosomal protein L22
MVFDKIGALVLKKCLSSLLDIVHFIFQTSASIYKMPKMWKTGEIIPASKKPIPKVDNDLRPITLTAILSKIQERVMLPKIMKEVLPHLDNLQFAYLPKRSTDDGINHLTHSIAHHLDNSPSNYARCLFIDYSSAFNTMQPHILLDKLERYNVNPHLLLWILNFLTDRVQYVRTSSETSSRISINTGGPQGCVLSAFLFIVYTNDMSENGENCIIIKYADDTVIIGLIKANDESHYKNTIEYVTNWCAQNYLELNTSKTKEVIFDLRRNKTKKDPIIINNSEVEIVPSYKYLGCTIQDDLKWDVHLKLQIKKATKRLYHVRCLKNLHVNSKIICMFYNATISSVLTYVIPTWFNACNSKQKKDLKKLRKKVCRMVSPDMRGLIEDLESVHNKKSISMLKKIMSDSNHPLSKFISLLPHGFRLNMPFCRTVRYKSTFVPSSIKLYNSVL